MNKQCIKCQEDVERVENMKQANEEYNSEKLHIMNLAIKKFLKDTPAWLKEMENPAYELHVRRGGACIACGIRPEKIKELYEAFKVEQSKTKT